MVCGSVEFFGETVTQTASTEKTYKEMEIVGYTVKCDTVSHFESHQPEKSGVK